jgi:hypothetical protein
MNSSTTIKAEFRYDIRIPLGNISLSPGSNIITDLLVSLQPKHSPSTTHILDPIFSGGTSSSVS